MHGEPYVCGLDAAMDVVGGKWKALILWALHERPHRFGELRRAVPGVTEKMLTQHLRELERDGILSRTDFHEMPPRVLYDLTDAGHSLHAALLPLGAWGEARLSELGIVPTHGAEPAGDPAAPAAVTAAATSARE